MKKLIRNKNQNGFTLIELLVVIAIIGLLASVVLLALNSARAKARDAKRAADIRQMATALEVYYNDNGAYPILASVGALSAATWIGGQSTYIGTIPSAPTPADGGCGSSGTTQPNNAYLYTAASPAANYSLTFCLGGITGSLPAGAHTASSSGIN